MSQTLHLGDAEVDGAELAALCQRYQVRELSLFGSAARGEMRPDSDIDLLVEFLPSADVGLVEHAGLMLELSQLLGRKSRPRIEERPETAYPALRASRRAARLCGVTPVPQ
jgi:predicted nucleotidyltransferase